MIPPIPAETIVAIMEALTDSGWEQVTVTADGTISFSKTVPDRTPDGYAERMRKADAIRAS